jgi:hypothetical protein
MQDACDEHWEKERERSRRWRRVNGNVGALLYLVGVWFLCIAWVAIGHAHWIGGLMLAGVALLTGFGGWLLCREDLEFGDSNQKSGSPGW